MSGKRAAAERAVDFIRDTMKVGLGTGSTARLFLEALAARREHGELQDILGVPTSTDTEQCARALGIPLASLEQVPKLDIVVDGADEVDGELRLIKGLGGALLWEKIVASAADRMVVIVDEGKLVERLGERSPLPVEVVPFGWSVHVPALLELGAAPELRRAPGGEPFVTDGGHYILDCRFPSGIADPEGIERALRARPGIVESGLFLGMASAVVVGGEDGVRVLERGGRDA
ncbi:MAG TPA: ribose-5-phosphate isomerase RpiA [Longimicrobiales bacterium]|nr:ribose-5-phosphate isomerase RpiA [Longimicrobiales bacterium]